MFNLKARITGKRRTKGKKGRYLRMLVSTLSIICILGVTLLFSAGCAQNVIGWVVRTFGPEYMVKTIPSTELGYQWGNGLVLEMNFRNFGCGGDDVYSNWWVQFTDVRAFLHDSYPDPLGLGMVFHTWCDDIDYYARLAWQGNSLVLDHHHANCSGFGFDIHGIPDEIEQWFFDYAKPMFMEEVLDAIEEKSVYLELGSDDLRLKFATLQGAVEQVLALNLKKGELRKLIGVIHTPTPTTPLCTPFPMSSFPG